MCIPCESNMVSTFFAGSYNTPCPICFEPWMVSWVRLGPEQHPPMPTKRCFAHVNLRRTVCIPCESNMVSTFFAGSYNTPCPICFEPWMVSWVRLGPEQHPPMSSLSS